MNSLVLPLYYGNVSAVMLTWLTAVRRLQSSQKCVFMVYTY